MQTKTLHSCFYLHMHALTNNTCAHLPTNATKNLINMTDRPCQKLTNVAKVIAADDQKCVPFISPGTENVYAKRLQCMFQTQYLHTTNS
jgi:hypothetical protein